MEDALDKFMQGKVLTSGWHVDGPRDIGRDGVSASRTYVARHPDGGIAFVKVLDPRGQKSLEEQELHIQQFRYESDILAKCGERNMKRVVRALGNGELQAEGELTVTVRYLIFEWADSDVRSQTDVKYRVHVTQSLLWLRHMATALMELHFSLITHQDFKPANVLVMPNHSAKLGDFGHACDQARPRPGGDGEPSPTSAPPELLYGNFHRSIEGRMAADMYGLGSLAIFLFTGVGLNTRLAHYLPAMHHWTSWRGSFEDALVNIQPAYDAAINEFTVQVEPALRDDLVNGVRWLTNPNPTLRGHPTNRQGYGSQYDLQRFVSLFNLLATKSEHLGFAA